MYFGAQEVFFKMGSTTSQLTDTRQMTAHPASVSLT